MICSMSGTRPGATVVHVRAADRWARVTATLADRAVARVPWMIISVPVRTLTTLPGSVVAGAAAAPGRPHQNWTATPSLESTWLAGGGVTENRTPKSLKVKSSVSIVFPAVPGFPLATNVIV
jgi:hypothetical protein